MRNDIQSWSPKDLQVGLMLQYKCIGNLVGELAVANAKIAILERAEAQQLPLEYAPLFQHYDGNSKMMSTLEGKVNWDAAEPLRHDVSSVPGHVAKEVSVKPKEAK